MISITCDGHTLDPQKSCRVTLGFLFLRKGMTEYYLEYLYLFLCFVTLCMVAVECSEALSGVTIIGEHVSSSSQMGD